MAFFHFHRSIFLLLLWQFIFVQGNDQASYLDLFDNYPSSGGGSEDGGDIPPTTDIEDGGEPQPLNHSCYRGDIFYSFNPRCQEEICRIKDILYAEPDQRAVIAKAKELSYDPKLHPRVWYSALTAVSLLRYDMQGIYKPYPEDVFPDCFIRADVIERANTRQAADQCVVVDGNFARGNGIENRLWYFREDIHVNSQHWFWHLANPLSDTTVRPDRRGELFYYFHHSMLARYNAERLANGLPFVTPFPLQHGYVMRDPFQANLIIANSGQDYANRPANTPMPERLGTIPLSTLIDWNQRIQQSLSDGFLINTSGTRIQLNTLRGIDLVGDITEASDASVNPRTYGNLHNVGHVFIAFAHDPIRTRVPGVMADVPTAMRDFAFYNWHTFINDIFDTHKRTNLPAYRPNSGPLQLSWDAVSISSVQVLSDSGVTNSLQTFWTYTNFTLRNGLDFLQESPSPPSVPVCVKHLNHEEFTYQITATLRGTTERAATVRIFLAPRFNGAGQQFSFVEQRRLFFVLDQFSIRLRPGSNVISRMSNDSSVTIPWRQGYESEENQGRVSNYCGCGWPHHLLLPRGTPSGMTFDLFTIITNGEEDAVVGPRQGPIQCETAFPLCGLLGRRYPDSKPMGYPFDRQPFTVTNGQQADRPVKDIEEFVSVIQNAFNAQIVITHQDSVA